MEELRAFLYNPDPSKSKLIKLRGPLTGGVRIVKNDPYDQLDRAKQRHRSLVIANSTDYAHEVQEKEMQLYMKNEMERDGSQSTVGLNSMELLSSYGDSVQNIEELNEEAITKIYAKYSFKRKEDTNNLSIHDFRQQIIDSISGFPVVIIEGPTGCGKTTQVPQWILDDSYANCKPCKIVVTQPRRIAAISIAKRVAQERGWNVGGLVGYQVALENEVSHDTRISYVTTGLLLQKLVAAKNMNEYTHVILDEVHERGQEMDFLLLVVKKLLYTASPHVKVILMSATFNRRVFEDYFKIPTPRGPQKTSTITIDKKEPMYTVKTFYLDHLDKFSPMLEKVVKPHIDSPGIAPEMHHLVLKLINAFEQIDKTEDNYVDRSEADLPSVLIFLPGINEIEELYACLTDLKLRAKVADEECAKYNWWVLPLHSTITADEQARVFLRSPVGHRKIILATNVAESSITVPDIKYVVDYCLMKILVADENTNFTSLRLAWASKTNCEQRAGRAGRVRDGRVYRLVYKNIYNMFSSECSPEILRCPLERLVLLAKMLNMGPPTHILALAMNPPNLSNIHRTILVLKEVGALKTTSGVDWNVPDGDITYLGRIMAKLPLDVRVTRLIMFGYIYGCFEESVIMAAAMTVKSAFSSPFRERLNAYNSKLTWADGSTSDSIAFLNVYKVWNHLRKQNYFRHPNNGEAQWARRFYVQVRALRELDDLVRELRARLSREGLEHHPGSSPWAKHELTLVLKLILAGAFYPQYFVQTSLDEVRERDAVRVLGGLDPRDTVYLRDFPENQPGELYATAIRNTIRQIIGDEPRVTIDTNSRKVFLTFSNPNENSKRERENTGDPTIPGQVVLPVYKAIKARQLKIDIRIPLLPVEKATELAAALNFNSLSIGMEKMVPRLPDIDDTIFPLRISQLISVGKFWAQCDDASTTSELMQIQKALNHAPLLTYTGSIAVGTQVVAPYTDASGTSMYRARVLRLLSKDMLEVLYIDYGSYGRIGVRNVFELPAGVCTDTPPLAVRCSLAGIAPAPTLHDQANWSPGALKLFTDIISRGPLKGQVYSVVHGVIAIELLVGDGQINVNKELLDRGFAVSCEESYDSKLNHDLRQIAHQLSLVQKRGYNREQIEMAFYQIRDIEPPNYKDCVSAVCLKGPHSPLETVVHNLMHAGRGKQVNIEWSSVNSVLLDTQPQELYERLLVAAEVGQNESASSLTLRHTTLMPNIPGLPAIISLLFCPSAELRRDETGVRYVSSLCGLGSDKDGTPYFPEHDILVNIDADLDVEDIGYINHIRHFMDYMMYCSDGQDVPTNTDTNFRSEIPKFIRADLLKLLGKRRKHREPHYVPNAWAWRSVDEIELLEITVPEMVENAVLFPLHTPIELHEPARELKLALKKDMEELKQLVSSTPTGTNAQLTCRLCGTVPMPVHAMRIHLYSNSHNQKEEEIKSVCP